MVLIVFYIIAGICLSFISGVLLVNGKIFASLVSINAGLFLVFAAIMSASSEVL